MVTTPRIITVDPTGAISRIVRSAMDLLDLSVIQIDVPSGSAALDEIRNASLVVSALTLDGNMKGFEFALRVKQMSPNTAVIILGDVNDPSALDEETASESPFVYMSRPVDIQQFLRVLLAGMESHEAMMEAIHTPTTGDIMSSSSNDMGPVPSLDVDAAKRVLDGLQADLGAIAIIMADRTGQTLIETGTTGYIDREELSHAMMPVMMTSIGVKDLVGGQISTVQLYDGENYDVFVLSIGLHHFMCVLFDGNQGARQFGLVNRFGRRAVEDLIGVIGAEAFFILPPQPKEEKFKKRQHAPATLEKEEEPVELARAEISFNEPEPVIEQLEAIDDDEFDVDALFSDEINLGEDLFDLDKVEELTKEADSKRKGKLDWDDAVGLGVLKD